MRYACVTRLEERRLCHAASERHETLLQLGLADGDPALIETLLRLQLRNQFAKLRALGLDLVHRVDFFLRKLAIALDLSMLIFHA